MKEVIVNGRVAQVNPEMDVFTMGLADLDEYVVLGFDPVARKEEAIGIFQSEREAVQYLNDGFIQVETDSKFDGVSVPGIGQNGNLMNVLLSLHLAMGHRFISKKVATRAMGQASYKNAIASLLRYVDGPTAMDLLKLIQTGGQDQ